MHLIIDGYEGKPQRLQDLEFIYGLLDEYPGRIGMRKIMPPYVFRYADSKPEDWGVSGFVLIAESHISLHTFPDKGYINIDIFSCKEFDAALVVEHMKEYFSLGKIRTKLLRRGLEYPMSIEEATGIVESERVQLSFDKLRTPLSPLRR